MANYDEWKQKYSTLNDNQKQMWNDKISWMDANSEARQFTERYNQEMNNNQQSNNNSSNFNNQNGTNWQNQQNFGTPTVQKTENQNNNQTNQTYNYDPNEKLDTSMFWASDGKVVVKEWTAQQTWRPDYQLDSDARTKEITDNLNAYWQTNREYFQDRNTYNNMFHYNERSDQQKAILDSYWKKKEDMNVAERYNTADGIKSWMNDAEITPDQLNYIKEYSPEAYKEWQQKQIDDINLRIANLATPADPTSNAELFNSLLNKLGLEPWDPYQIYDNWYDMAERLWVFSDSEKLKSYQNQLDQNHSKMESIMSRYANSTWWTVSDALAAARMNKALAPYQQREVDLQNSYTTLLNGRNSNLAIANQSAQALAMQAQEDQRIWNQRLQGLGFAMTTAQYRSPEQQAQLQLQTASIQNDMNLLQTSMQNDLNRYNAYATAKMQNQLQQELTDLSVEDETQLKANLNNALSDYYKNYWDIIQRSQAQAVEDIMAYAKKKWISVAQAMTENFIKPLQNKAEYKQKVATDYGMIAKQSITSINWRSVIMTTNPNWSISYQYINDDRTAVESTYTVWDTAYVKLYNGETMTAEEYNKRYWSTSWTVKPYDMVDSKVFDTSPVSHSYYTLADFLIDPKYQEWQRGWQCAAFVNDYLEKIWVGRYFGTEDVKTRESWCNSDTAKVWTIAVFDYNHYTDWKNYGHVWIVVDTDENGFWVLDSNWDLKKPWVIEKRYIRYGSSSCKWFFDPSQPPRTTMDTSSSSLSSVDEAKKQNYLEEAKRWKLTPSKIEEIWDLAAEQWWDDEWREAFKWWQNWDYSDTQLKRMDKADDTFKSNPDVKNFDEAKTQFQQLAMALNDTSWVWDMSAIFTFMKTLDPTSVVRESEFNSAAATAWVLNPQAILQSIEKNIDWKFLTPNQREDFKKIAREFVRIKAEAYQQQYDFLKKRYEWAWLSEIDLPPNNAQILLDSLWGTSTWPEDVISDIYSSAMNTNTSYSSNGWNASYGGYSPDFISQMIHSKL